MKIPNRFFSLETAGNQREGLDGASGDVEGLAPSYRVVIDFQRLDGSLDGEAVLGARWAIADAEGKEFLAGDKIVLRQPLQEPSYAALVTAESLLVAELSKKIAGEINGLIKGP